MAAGDSHQGTFAWKTIAPIFSQQCEGSVAPTNCWVHAGISFVLNIQDVSGNPEYTLVGSGLAASLSNSSITNDNSFVLTSDDVVLYDASNLLLSENGSIVLGGIPTGDLFGRFSVVGAGVFGRTQTFVVHNVGGGTYDIGFLEQ